VRSQVLNNTFFTDKFNDLNNYNKNKDEYIRKIKDTEFKVAVISDPARMKEGLTNKPALGKTKACCLISRERKLL
jgi:exopolysaccharide biosynthesis protein